MSKILLCRINTCITKRQMSVCPCETQRGPFNLAVSQPIVLTFAVKLAVARAMGMMAAVCVEWHYKCAKLAITKCASRYSSPVFERIGLTFIVCMEHRCTHVSNFKPIRLKTRNLARSMYRLRAGTQCYGYTTACMADRITGTRCYRYDYVMGTQRYKYSALGCCANDVLDAAFCPTYN